MLKQAITRVCQRPQAQLIKISSRNLSDGFDDTHESSYGENRDRGSVGEKCMNSVTLLGRVGNTPKLRGEGNNRPFVTFRMATNKYYRPQFEGAEARQTTQWHNITIFHPNLVEMSATNVTKGMRVLVQGEITYRVIQDQDGNEVNTTSIIANDIVRLTPAPRMDE